MRDSVLTTGLLPDLGQEDERTFSTPGLCRPVVLQIRKRTNRWMHINTDRMAVRPGGDPPNPGRQPAPCGWSFLPMWEGTSNLWSRASLRCTAFS